MWDGDIPKSCSMRPIETTNELFLPDFALEIINDGGLLEHIKKKVSH